MTTSAIQDAMEIFSEEYGDKFIMSKSRSRVWRQILKSHDAETIRAAAYHLVSTRPDWPPDVATMRKTIIAMEYGSKEQESAQAAWGKILQNIQGKDLELTELEKAALKQTGSMYDLKRSQNIGFDRTNFCKAFEALLKKRDEDRMMLPEVKAVFEKNSKQLTTGGEDRLKQLVQGTGK